MVYIEPFKLQLKMIGSKYCVEYYFYDEDNLPVQSFAFVIATSDEEAIQKAQNYSTSKITIISCTNMEDIETNDIGQSLVDEFVDDNAIEAQEK